MSNKAFIRMMHTIKLRIIRSLAVLLCIIIIVPNMAFAIGKIENDIKGHWAYEQLYKWLEGGLVTGYPDKTFRPDEYINRIEFITLVNRAFQIEDSSEVSFKDVSNTDWFYQEVGKALNAGYISGYNDNTVRPYESISRQEVAIILTKLLSLDTNTHEDVIKIYKDEQKIPEWSRKEVNTIVRNGYMSGYPDNTFKSTAPITRAEAIIVLDRILNKTTILDEAGEYILGKVFGVVVIASENITLKDTIINGNLLFANEIGEGDVTLNNVIVTGITTINGCRQNSIIINDSNLFDIVVDKEDGELKIVARGTTTISSMKLKSSAILVERNLIGPGFYEVEVDKSAPEKTELELHGEFEYLKVGAKGVNIKLVDGTINNMLIDENGEATIVTLSYGTEIITMVIEARINVTGKGRIRKVVIKANGVRIEQEPDIVEIEDGFKAIIGYGSRSSKRSSSEDNLSSIATLKDLKINDVTVEGFNASIKQYFIVLPMKATEIPMVTATATDNKAEVTIEQASKLPGVAMVKVTAEDKKSTMIYRIYFSVNNTEPDDNSPPIACTLPEHVIKINETIILSPVYLATNGETVTNAISEYEEIAGVKALGMDGLEISGLGIGKTTITAVVSNEYGNTDITVDIIVVGETGEFDDEYIVTIVKDELHLSVLDAKGKNKIPRILLPASDTLDYGTEIVWETDNEEYIEINEFEAIIHRRGTESHDCSGDHDEEGSCDAHFQINLMSKDSFTIYCSGDDCGDDEGCSDSGGKKTIVHLIANIAKGNASIEKTFTVNIYWGWGKEITIEEGYGTEEEHQELPPEAINIDEQEIWLGQFPLILTADDLASHGKIVSEATVTESVYQTVYESIYDDLDVVTLKIIEGGRLKITPINLGEATIKAEISNETDSVWVEFGVQVRQPESVTDNIAVEETEDRLSLSIYTWGNESEQENRIIIPNTDYFGYGTDIIWTTDNEEFIEIPEGKDKAIIHRRGNRGGGCDEHSVSSLLNLSDFMILSCEDEIGSEDDCGGDNGSQGGNITEVKLTATIRRGNTEKTKVFLVSIPWGWGRKITIKEY